MVTGLGDYIRANAPVAVNMPLAAYDDYFAGPWATAREHEAKHRELTRSIGESIRGKSGVMSYLDVYWASKRSYISLVYIMDSCLNE